MMSLGTEIFLDRPTAAAPRRACLIRSTAELKGGALVATAIRAYNYVPDAILASESLLSVEAPSPTRRGVRSLAKCRESRINEALEEFGFVLAMHYRAVVVPTNSGAYECVIDDYSAVGDTWSESVVRA